MDIHILIFQQSPTLYHDSCSTQDKRTHNMQPDDIQGLAVEGTSDRFDEWWELEHSEEDVDDVDYDVMDDKDE